MTIDDLPSLIPAEHQDLRADLVHWIAEWKRSTDDVERLSLLVEKWLGNVWINDANAFSALMQTWQSFKYTSIEGVGAQTMDERLFTFGLLESWNEAASEERQRLLAKVLANA